MGNKNILRFSANPADFSDGLIHKFDNNPDIFEIADASKNSITEYNLQNNNIYDKILKVNDGWSSYYKEYVVMPNHSDLSYQHDISGNPKAFYFRWNYSFTKYYYNKTFPYQPSYITNNICDTNHIISPYTIFDYTQFGKNLNRDN